MNLLSFVGPIVFVSTFPVLYGLALVGSASYRDQLRRRIAAWRRDRRVMRAAAWANDHDDEAVAL